MGSASVTGELTAGFRGRHCKIVLNEDLLRFRDIRNSVHRSPWSPAPATKCSRHRTVTSVINRYYDPSTDQFISVDPAVAQTNQPYVFTNDNPLNSTDPLGQCGGWFGFVCKAFDATRHGIAANSGNIGIGLGITAAIAAAAVLILPVSVVSGGVALSLGVVAFTAGTTASILDTKKCLGGAEADCAGVILGGVSSLAGGTGVIATAAGSGAVANLFGGFSVNVGIASLVSDVGAAIAVAKKVLHPAVKKKK